jgi:hydroxymethylpyrimidine pyrophosphatase-like HAD family hydrolase
VTVLPRVVACDLDGTLLRSDGTLSERTRRALAAAQDGGALVVLCTARPVRWVQPMAAVIGGRPIAVCANGGVVWDLQRELLLAELTLDPGAAQAVVVALDAAFPGGSWAVERTHGFAHEPAYRPRWPVPAETVIASVHALLKEPPVKLLFRHDGHSPDEMLGPAREQVGPLAELTHSNSAEGLLEISAAGVNKASTLARVCGSRTIGPEAVIAFGDMPNDLAMLEWAGNSVAVANAHPDVLAAAGELTLSNDDDGVARVLERIWSPASAKYK